MCQSFLERSLRREATNAARNLVTAHLFGLTNEKMHDTIEEFSLQLIGNDI